MSSHETLKEELSQKMPGLGLKLWVALCLCVFAVIVLVLFVISMWVVFRRKTRRTYDKFPQSQTTDDVKDIEIVTDAGQPFSLSCHDCEGPHFGSHKNFKEKDSRKTLAHLTMRKSSEGDNLSQCSSIYYIDKAGSSHSGDDGSLGAARRPYSPHVVAASPLVGLPDGSHLGWGYWFTLRDLEYATNRFSKEHVIGEGGYGVVYRGRLLNGTEVAVKKLLNDMGQAEKEFRVEVEAIGHVRHKNLVRLLGYCVEGIHRVLVYEYVNNGNLEQWLHGAMRQYGALSWTSRMKVILGTAKALAYLHEAIEPKVVHRDIKSSNILIDDQFNSKVSDFGLAKLLGSGKSHVATRVMGTFGYVAPEYANSGLLNEKSDVYSFGVLLLEAVTGRDPVDHNRPPDEVNLVEWFKLMVGSGRVDELLDPELEAKPTAKVLKRTLLVAMKCIHPDSEERPNMGSVVRMLEADDDNPFFEGRRNRRRQSASVDSESLRECSSSDNLDKKAEASSSS